MIYFDNFILNFGFCQGYLKVYLFQAEECWPALTSSQSPEERVLPVQTAGLLHPGQGGGGADSHALCPDPGHTEGGQE